MAEVSGGEKFAQVLSDIAKRLGNGTAELKVGFLEGATYPDGTPVALVAAVQNYGAPSRGIPPRPFFSNMVATKQAEWGPALGGMLVDTGYDVEKALEMLGEGIAGQLRESIVQTNTPALAPATAKAKGFDKPLVNTGHMLNSVDYAVEGAGQ